MICFVLTHIYSNSNKADKSEERKLASEVVGDIMASVMDDVSARYYSEC